MPLEINAQYTRFVQFAEQQMQAGRDKAIARDAGAAAGEGALAGHAITAAEGDKVAPLRRSRANKDANDATRELFRRSIVEMFGGEANIPRRVKDAMLLKDYDCGKPLTARRIMAVKAEVDRIVAQHAAFNEEIAGNFAKGRFERLPQDLRDGLAHLADDLRAVFGAEAVPPGAAMSTILNPFHVKGEVDALRRAADAQGRDLTAAEILGAYAGAAFERLAYKALGAPVLARIQARQPDFALTAPSVGAQFETRHPGILAEIRLCRSPADIAAVLRNHEEQINAFVDLVARSHAACATVESRAKARLAAALGVDPRIVEARVSTGKLFGEAKDLVSRIMHGGAPGSREPGYDVEAAFDALVDEFVQKRIAACAAIDALDLPEDAKNRWKVEYACNREPPPLTPAQLFEVLQSVDARKIEGALSKGLPMKIAVEMLNNVAQTVVAACRTAAGNPRVLAKEGADGMMAIFGMLIVAAEARNPALAPAIQNAGAAFFDPVDAYCEGKALSDAATFVKTLSVRGGTVKTVSVMDKGRFLAVVGAEADAALAETGIADAKVRKDVRDSILKRAETLLARASGLKELSDFLAAVRADVAAVKAKQDEMVATYSAGLAPETLPILAKLVSVLDWRPRAAAASEAIVRSYAEDMKAWRNVEAGSAGAKGLEEVLQRRMNGYLKDVLAGNAHATFNTDAHPGLFQTFLDDLPRCTFVVNGTTVSGATLQERLVPFLDAIKDPAKRKTVSVMVNQQIYGDYTASVGNRLPFSGWKNGMPDEPVADIPGIGTFASRDVSKTGYQLFDTGPMTFAIEVAPDESTVTVRATSPYPLHADVTLPSTFVGTCTVTQEFVIDFTGAEPAIRDLKIGQTLA